MYRYLNESFDECQKQYEHQYEFHRTPEFVLYEVEELNALLEDKQEHLGELEAEIRELSREIEDLRSAVERLADR